MELLRTLSVEIGVRRCGTPEAERAAHAVADAFAALGLEPRFQEFPLLGYEAEEPLLEVDGERWEAGPCMYAHPGEVEGDVRRLSDGIFAVGDEGRLRRSPFGVHAIPFMLASHVTTPPTAFISPADAERLRDGMRARLVVRGRFVPGLRDRNVIAEVPGESEETVVVGAHYDSVWRGPGAIDNATGVEGLVRVAERLVGRKHPRSLTVRRLRRRGDRPGRLEALRRRGEVAWRGRPHRRHGQPRLHRPRREPRAAVLTPGAARACRGDRARALGLYDRYGVVTELGEDAGTDHLPFAQARIPAMSVLHFPYDEYHSPEDSSDLVDEALMADAVDLAVAMVESQLAEPVERAE